MTDTATATTPEPARALGIPVDMPPEDWTPIKVIGVAVCFDEDGDVVTWPFTSELLAHYEAVGLLAVFQQYLEAMSQQIHVHVIDGSDLDDDD